MVGSVLHCNAKSRDGRNMIIVHRRPKVAHVEIHKITEQQGSTEFITMAYWENCYRTGGFWYYVWATERIGEYKYLDDLKSDVKERIKNGS